VVGEIPTIFETLIGLVPGNIFQAMVDGRFDQVVVVCALIGIGVLMLPKEPKARLSQSFSDLSMLMSKVVGIIMGLAPFGICALNCQFRGQVRKQDFRRACKIHCLCVPWDILYVYALCHPGIPVHQNRIRPLFQDRFQHHDYLLQHLFQHQFHTNQHGMRG